MLRTTALTRRSAVTDTGVHAPITEAAEPQDKQQEEEDSMEGTHTVCALRFTMFDYLTVHKAQQRNPIFMLAWTGLMHVCCLQWAVKDITTNREAKRFSPTFTIGGYPWYDCDVLHLYILCQSSS